MQQFPNYKLFKPQNQKECDKVIEILRTPSTLPGESIKNVK